MSKKVEAKVKNEAKEPLIHLTKRTDVSVSRAWKIRILACVVAFLVCGIASFALIGKLREEPGKIVDFYKSFIEGSFGNTDRVWTFFKNVAILLCISLALTPAFRMKYWNIGAEGQTLMGVFGAIAVAFYFGNSVPKYLLVIMMFLGALLCGAIWALIPAIFKATWNTNETLFTLMMNYIATFFVAYFISIWIPNGNSSLGRIEASTLFADNHTSYIFVIISTVILTVLSYIYLNRTKHGYEISVVGESQNTARYIGINVWKVCIRTNLISGALCGFAGFLLGAGLNQTITTESVGGQGFTAIMVSWLGKFNPAMMTVTSGLITFLDRGGNQIMETFELRGAFSDVIVGIILLFIIGCEFFLNYKVHIRKSNKKEGKK